MICFCVSGFLNLGLPECPGNAGLKDQLMAFQWVKENVQFFGGDANNITVFGQSAGASSIHLHMMSPLSDGKTSGVALPPSVRFISAMRDTLRNLPLSYKLNGKLLLKNLIPISGLFHKCILQSGSALSTWSFCDAPEKRAFELGHILGFRGDEKPKLLQFLKRIDVRDLAAANETLRSVLKKVPTYVTMCRYRVVHHSPTQTLNKSAKFSLQ